MTTSECDDLRLGAGFLGQVLADRYRIVAAMEQGGMGVIYRAWDLHASRYNVVKIPKKNVSAERFAREMAMLGRIDHAHVVPILASGELRGVPYAVMPYLAGGTSRSDVRKYGGNVFRHRLHSCGRGCRRSLAHLTTSTVRDSFIAM